MTDQELAAIEARANAAAPGPWGEPYADESGYLILANDSKLPQANRVGELPASEEDRIFIGHAREDIPALIAEVRRARAALMAIVGRGGTAHWTARYVDAVCGEGTSRRIWNDPTFPIDYE